MKVPTQAEWRANPEEALRTYWRNDQEARAQLGNFSVELPLEGFQSSAPFLRMVEAGSKGKLINLQQMDQDYLGGVSIDRFWENATAGRISLAQSKIQTAEVGYLSRRLIQFTQDVVLEGSTVRDFKGDVVCFGYGLPYQNCRHVGILATQALCHPLTQETLDSFHNIHGEVRSVGFITSLFSGSCQQLRDILERLGVEAARQYVHQQLLKYVAPDGSPGDSLTEHMGLLADLLTQDGQISMLGRRCARNLLKDPLSRASYEEMTRNFALAALNGETDPIRTVAAKVMVGALD